MKMLRCEMEVFDAIDDMLIADEELMSEIEAEIYEEMETNDHKQPLYKLLTSQLDANISEITLTVFTDDTDEEIYSGKANLYPYEYDTPIADYNIYNIGDKVYMDVWGVFPKWRDIEISDNIINIPYNEESDIHNTPFGEMTTEEFNEWKKSI